VDVLRALVIGAMVLVNNLGGAPRVPWWTQHLPAEVDGYSLADLVLPWFLFLAGVSLTLSLRRYLPGRRLSALARIGPRAAGLLLLGLILVNAERLDGAATGLRTEAWLTLAVLGAAVVLWSPRPGPRPRLSQAVKLAGALLLVVMLIVYRGNREDGGSAWLVPSWWGILGIIGWAYLVGSLAYLAAGGRPAALMGLTGLAVAIAIGSARGRVGLLAAFQPLFEVHEFFGSETAALLAGSSAGALLVDRGAGEQTVVIRALRLAALGAGLWLAGWFLRPLHGYHKLGSTESWALVAAGQGALMLALCHALVDRTGEGARAPSPAGLAAWLALAGQNALLAYLVAEWMHPATSLIGLDLTPGYDRGGAVAIANAAAVAIGVLVLAAVASHRRFVIKL
jgi:predicted acyltransferase